MIFRLKIVIPLAIFLMAGGVFLYFFRHSAAKYAMESGWPAPTKLSLKKLNWALGSRMGMEISGGRISDPKKREALMEWGQSSLIFLSTPLGFGRVYVEEMALDAMVVRPMLSESEAASEFAVQDTTAAGEAMGFMPDLDFKGLDHREILERLTGQGNLESEKKVAVLKEDAQRTYDKWKALTEDKRKRAGELKGSLNGIKERWSDPAKVSDLKRRFDALRGEFKEVSDQKFDAGNMGQMAASYQRIRELKDKTQNLKQEVQSFRQEMKGDLDTLEGVKDEAAAFTKLKEQIQEEARRLESEARDVRGAADTDLAMLKKELDPKSFDAGKITRLLFGKEWEEKVRYYLAMYEKLQEYLPEIESESGPKPEEVAAVRQKDQPVTYERQGDLPDFTLARLRLSGSSAAQPGAQSAFTFRGEIYDVTSDEALLGRFLRWQLDGDLGQGGGHYLTRGAYPRTREHQDQRKLEFELSGRPLKDRQWGPPDLRVVLEEGVMEMKMAVDLAKAPALEAKGHFLISGAKLSVPNSVKEELRGPLVGAIEKVLAKPIPFRLRHRPHHAPDLSFGSDLDDVFKDALKGYLDARLGREREKLEEKFRGTLESKLAKLAGDGPVGEWVQKYSSTLTGEGGEIGNLLAAAQGALLGQRGAADELERGGDELVQGLTGTEGGRQELEKRLLGEAKEHAEKELKERAERELKARAEEEAKRRLLEQAGGTPAQPGAPPPQEQAKQEAKDKASEIENKVKDKLKKLKL